MWRRRCCAVGTRKVCCDQEVLRAAAFRHGQREVFSVRFLPVVVGEYTVSSHNFNLQNFKSRASNPRTIAYVHFNMLVGKFESPRDWAHFFISNFDNWP